MLNGTKDILDAAAATVKECRYVMASESYMQMLRELREVIEKEMRREERARRLGYVY